MQSSTTTSYDRARAYFNAFLDVTKKNNSLVTTTADVQNLADAFARSEFLNNRAFGTGATTIADDIDRRSVSLSNRTDSLKNLLELDYAMTDHGSSVLSPAAYFYDLMRIVFSQINIDATSDPAKYSLLARRPDLLDIPLDNDNAEVKLFSTISIINYVLARQLCIRDDASLLPSNNPSSKLGYADLLNNYDRKALDKLKDLSFDIFHLPFDVDFEAQLMYFFAMGKTLYELSLDRSKIMGSSLFYISPSSAKYFLQLSDVVAARLLAPAADLLSTMKDDNDTSIPVRSNFLDSKIFCKKTGISYERLGELLHLNTSDTQERRYVDAIGVENFYINQGPDPVRLALEDNSDKEWLQYLTNERLKRIGQFHFMSQKMGLTADEMELVFSLVQGFDIGVLARFKQFKDQFNLSTLEAVNFLTRSTDKQPLYTAVMRNICPIPVNSFTSQMDLLKLKNYLNLLSDINTNIANQDLPAALQTTAYVCRMTGVLPSELVYIYADSVLKNMPSPPTMGDINIFIKSVYELGRLEQMFDRSLFELCQLACYAQGGFLASPAVGFAKDTVQIQVVSQGIKLLLNGSQNFQLTINLPQCDISSTNVQALVHPDTQDLVFVLHQGTASGWTEVHIASAATGYQSLVQVITDMGATGPTDYRFLAARQGQLFFVRPDVPELNKCQLQSVNCSPAWGAYGDINTVTLGSWNGSRTYLLAPDNNDFIVVNQNVDGSPGQILIFTQASAYQTVQTVNLTNIQNFAGATWKFVIDSSSRDIYAVVVVDRISNGSSLYRLSSANGYSVLETVQTTLSAAYSASVQFQLLSHGISLNTDLSRSTTLITATLTFGGLNLLQDRVISYIELAKLNERLLKQNINLESLLLSRFGILSLSQAQRVADVQQNLLQPFFRDFKIQEPNDLPTVVYNLRYAFLPSPVKLNTPWFINTDEVQFLIAPDNQDLFIVVPLGTRSGKVELYILSALKGYYIFSKEPIITSLPVQSNLKFSLASNRDLVAISMQLDAPLPGGVNRRLPSALLNALVSYYVLSASGGYRDPFPSYDDGEDDGLATFNARKIPRLPGGEIGTNFQFLFSPITRDVYAFFNSSNVVGCKFRLQKFLYSSTTNYQTSITQDVELGFSSSEEKFIMGANGNIYLIYRDSQGKVAIAKANAAQPESFVPYSSDITLINPQIIDKLQFDTTGNLFLCEFLAPKEGVGVDLILTILSKASYYKDYYSSYAAVLPVSFYANNLQNDDRVIKTSNQSVFAMRATINALKTKNQMISLDSDNILIRPNRIQSSAISLTLLTAAELAQISFSQSQMVSGDSFEALKLNLAKAFKLENCINPYREVSIDSSLSTASAASLMSYLGEQLITPKSLEKFHVNLAKIFNLDKSIFYRLMTSFNDLGCSFYHSLLSNRVYLQGSLSGLSQPVYFIERVISLINLFHLRPKSEQDSRSQLESIVIELNAAVQELADQSSNRIIAQRVPSNSSMLTNSTGAEKMFTVLSEYMQQFTEENIVPKNLKSFFDNVSSNLHYLKVPFFSSSVLDFSRFQQAVSPFYKIKKVDLDDIDVFIELLDLSRDQYTDGMLDNLPQKFFDTMFLYKELQSINGSDTMESLLVSFWDRMTDLDNSVISRFLKISSIDWNNLKKALFANADERVSSMYVCITKVNQLTRLKALIEFFEYDTSLVIDFLQNKNSTSIAQHLGQVLAKKDPSAYDKATRRFAERKRDALVDAVLKQFSTNEYKFFNLKNADKLSEYLLIDVSTSGEDTQTPISQAHSTLQWYIRRCVEGVEKDSYGLTMNVNIPRAWWNWIQNYRVWEANRQVFLYSENFLSPDLRVKQSEQFKQFSKLLRKAHLDDEAVKDAYLQYVKDIMNFRGISLSTACAEPAIINSQGGMTRKLHLFASDNATPKQYYHCTFDQVTSQRPSSVLQSASEARRSDFPNQYFQEATLAELSDVEGWGEPKYYSTIKAVAVGEVVYLIARSGEEGLLLYRYDSSQGSWVRVTNKIDFSDKNGWSLPQYYSTIQPIVVGSVIYICARLGVGMIVYRYNTLGPDPDWLSCSLVEPSFSDTSGWAQPEYYKTIQYVLMGKFIYLFARHGSNGILVRKYDTTTNGWTTCPSLVGFKDSDGFNDVKYYSTIQYVAISSSIIYLFACSVDGIVVYKYATQTNVWSGKLSTLGSFATVVGWGNPQYYSTIQYVPIGSIIYLFARSVAGIVVYKYDTDTDKLGDQLFVLTDFSDSEGWDNPQYYRTIRCVSVGKVIYLFARYSTGILGSAYNTETNTLTTDDGNIARLTNFSDILSWNNEKYYSTILSLVVGNLIYLLGRGLNGIQLYKYDYNIRRNWTYWEKIPLSISSQSSSDATLDTSLSAIFVHDRPYLYWVQKSKTSGANSQTKVQLFCSYQHLDGSWQSPQLLDNNDWKGFLPNVDSSDSSKADQLVFDPKTVKITIENHGKWNPDGKCDSSPYQLDLVGNFWEVLYCPPIFNVLLGMLYERLSTQPIETATRLDLSVHNHPTDVKFLTCATDGLRCDSLWGQYYWELMYFVPLTVANALQVSQQYDKALTWYQTIFDPSQRSQNKPSFVFPPFTIVTGNDVLTHLLNTKQLTDMHSHAFEAHRIATLFGSLPYKKYVVMQYIRSLLAWGDALFTGNTRETITEAVGRYLAVSDLLGDSPRALYSAQYDRTIQHKMLHELIPSSGYRNPNVSGTALTNVSSNSLVIFPYNYTVSSYFHVPENREFMGLWIQVSDRLYKIRHCLSIDGIKQQLALYSPPIDPHELVRAVATRGGEFVREMLTQISGANRSPYRFLVLLERAKEFAGYVERLGDSLLSILERQDSAELVKLNNEFAQEMLDAVTQQKESAKNQAELDKQMLGKRRDNIQRRIDYYNGLLPNSGMSPEEIAADVARGGAMISTIASHFLRATAEGVKTAPKVTAVATTTPGFQVKAGPEEVASSVYMSSAWATSIAVGFEYTAGQLDRTAHYKSRYAEWKLQLSLAQKELEELDLQQQGADLRVKVAEEDLKEHQMSITHQRNLTLYNNNQFTNLDLYTWYADQLYDLLGNAYNLALRVANQASAAYQYEMGTASSVSLSSGFWTSSRKGLLSGPKLSQRLHEMQQEYLEKNKRVPEVEKVLSLRDLLKDWPTALANLLTPAGVSFKLGADLFQDFAPGANKTLSIKMISVTVPALAGPNQQVNLILTHQSSGEQIYISRGISATGMFSSSMDDARYLPFEGRTVGDDASRWTLSIGNASGQYLTDEMKSLYNSITDIQLRVYYQIRQASPSMSR